MLSFEWPANNVAAATSNNSLSFSKMYIIQMFLFLPFAEAHCIFLVNRSVAFENKLLPYCNWYHSPSADFRYDDHRSAVVPRPCKTRPGRAARAGGGER